MAFLLDYFTEIAVTVRLNCFKCTEYTLNLKPPELCPSIAQLEERWTVVASCLLSIGRRYKSGSKDYSILSYSIPFEGVTSSAAVAEWLRRLTRNQFPSGSVGSNPIDCEIDALTLNLGFLPEENDLLHLCLLQCICILCRSLLFAENQEMSRFFSFFAIQFMTVYGTVEPHIG